MSIELEVAMKRGLFLLLLLCVIFLASAEKAAAQDSTNRFTLDAAGPRSRADSAHSAQADTASLRWPSFIGGDLFVTGELYALHFNGPSSIESAFGLGAEVRIKSVFLGFIMGFSGDEGIPGLHGIPSLENFPYSPDFTYASLYAGIQVGEYRIEAGEVNAKHYAADMAAGYQDTRYSSAFVGVSRRFSKVYLIEPVAKIVFPLSATYPILSAQSGSNFPWVTRHYRLSDFFLSLGVKVGIGVN